jgi:epoxyqueuosine reductase
MNRSDAASAIKAAALRIGFDAVGIAEALPLIDPINRYKEWLGNGFHGMMQYLERNNEAREDVGKLLEGARSVVVVAKNYYTPYHHNEHNVGKISRYAWGDDYHTVMGSLLDALGSELISIVPGSEIRRYTDTGAVMEKEWAVRSGIAWRGKHSNVLRRDIGSWFFLGVIITTADLEADIPMQDFCGTCTACIDACPTGAITQPMVVDATKCLSYWTIEVKPEHSIPDDITSSMDGWLFGCDVCQDVCPWNRFQTPCNDSHFMPRNNVMALSPEAVVNLQPSEFILHFRNSPLKRPKLEGLKRNARALLATVGSKKVEDE